MGLPHIVSQEGREGLISSPYSVQCSGKLGPQVQWSNVSVCFTVALGLPSNMILQQRIIQFSRLSFLIIMVHRRKEEKDWSYNLSWFRYRMTFQFSAAKYYYYYLSFKENNKICLWYQVKSWYTISWANITSCSRETFYVASSSPPRIYSLNCNPSVKVLMHRTDYLSSKLKDSLNPLRIKCLTESSTKQIKSWTSSSCGESLRAVPFAN